MADFSKGMIYGMVLLTAVGAGTHVWLTRQFDEAGAETKRSLKKLRSIASMREDIQVLESELKNDLWLDATSGGKSRYVEFFSNCAQKAGMVVPPDSGKPNDSTPRSADGAFEDKSYELSWKTLGKRGSRAQGFTRENVAKFLWNLEYSPLLRVTELSLERVKDADDLWIPNVQVTERKPTSSATQG